MRLPWKGEFVPHAILDVNRGCNIMCRACFNYNQKSIKSFTEIESELDYLLSRRRLSSIAILGGEVLLHPQIIEIVKLIKSKDISAEIFTNGLLLDDEFSNKLKDAGIDIIFLHIQLDQKRPDFPEKATLKDLRSLYEQKAKLLAKYGIDSGIIYTAKKDSFDELLEIVKLAIESPYLNYLCVTCYRDHSNIQRIKGDIDQGFFATLKNSNPADTRGKLSLEEVSSFLNKELGLMPFAFIGSNVDDNDPRWLSFLVGSFKDHHNNIYYDSIKSSFLELLLMILCRIVQGKYPTYLKQKPAEFKMQLILNALAGGSFSRNVKLLSKSWRANTAIRAKRLVIQNLAEVLENGKIVHCLNCPDAVPKNNHLVPVCICDLVDVEA